MNKHLRRFLVLAVGCSLVFGSFSFAAETNNKKVETTGDATAVTLDWDDEDWDDEDWGDEDWDDLEGDAFYPENGADFVKELKEYYDLSNDEAEKLEKIFDEMVKLEEEAEAAYEKIDSKWEEIDKVLLKYEQDELMNEETPTLAEFYVEMGLIQDSLTDAEQDTVEGYYNELVKLKEAGDIEAFYTEYDEFIDWTDEALDDSNWEVFDEDFEGDYDDFDEDYDFEDDMTDEEYQKMIIEEIKEFDLDAFLKELGVEFKTEDVKAMKAIQESMLEAAQEGDMEKIEKFYDEFEAVLEKYYDAIDEHFEGELEDE